MTRKIFVVAAALAVAAGAWAQGGGASGGGTSSGSEGASSGSGTSGGGGGGSGAVQGSGGASEDARNQAAARQQAPSVTNIEGAGGHVPNPVAEGQGSERSFGNAPPLTPGHAGRPANEPNVNPQGGATAGAAATAPDQRSEVKGRVALVNPKEHEIAIDAGTATTQVKVAKDAKITIDGKQASFGDIPKGAEVRASLDRSGDEPQAKTIEITSGAKKK